VLVHSIMSDGRVTHSPGLYKAWVSLQGYLLNLLNKMFYWLSQVELLGFAHRNQSAAKINQRARERTTHAFQVYRRS
jgi:hypothetical protein